MNLLYDMFTITLIGSVIYIIFKGTEQITKRYFSASWHYGLIKCIALFYCVPFGRLIRLFIGDGHISTNSLFYINDQQKLKISNATDYIQKISNVHLLRFKLYDLLIIIWILGIIILLLKQVICYVKFRCIVMNNKRKANEYLQDVADLCGMNQGIKQPIHIYVNEFISTPMLISSSKPIIILPNDNFNIHNAEYVLSHELTHFKYKDLLIKLGVLFIRTVHWFNPFAYLLSKDLNKWCEYACDEKNAVNLSIDKKKKYGLAILDAAAEMPVYGSNFSTPFLLPKQNLKERLTFMLNVKRMKTQTRILSFAIAVVFLSLGFVTVFTSEVSNEIQIIESVENGIVNINTDELKFKTTISKDLDYEDTSRTKKLNQYLNGTED